MFISRTPKTVESGRFKGNDILIRGFAEFVRREVATRPFLVLLDREVSGETEIARALIRSLDIEQYVLWARSRRPFGFTRDELTTLYSHSDAVADDFSVGWFGSIVLEGLATERPVISYVDEGAMKRLYPWHPMLSANTPTGIANHLERLAADPDYKRECGRRRREWVLEFHSSEGAGRRYVANMRTVLSTLPSPEARR